MNDLIGQSLGRYHITEQLGEGGMAVVYKAYDTRLERDVAVKVIRTERLTIETMAQTLKRFEREAKSLAKLTHPNIVPITDYGEHEGKPYLVMPHLPGGTLKQMLGKPMGWEETIRILLPIARALAFAHQQGIIHRDVKPSNILITSSGEPMLTDFGIAKILVDSDSTAELTGTGMGIGTPEYMAPEQWTGHVTPQTDIYALGVVFYEMVTGRKPYQADTPAALLLKQANDPLPRPRSFVSGLPDAVEKVLFKALAKGLEDRYQSMGELVKAMEGLLAGKPIKEVRPARRVKEETLTAVEIEPDEKTQVDEKLIVREKSARKGWVWGVVVAGIVVLVFAIVLASKPGTFNLFPTATATIGPTSTPTATPNPLEDNDWPMNGHDPSRLSWNDQSKLHPPLSRMFYAEIPQFTSETLIYSNGRFYVGGQSLTEQHNAVYSISFDAPKSKWKFIIPDSGGSMDHTPTYWKGKVMFGGQGDDFLYAVAESGSLVWKLPGFQSLYGTAGLVDNDNMILYGVKSISSVDLVMGSINWSFPFSGQGLIASWNHTIVASSRGKGLFALSSDTGENLWARSDIPAHLSEVISYGDVVYYAGGDRVFAVDLRTGTTLWVYPLPSAYNWFELAYDKKNKLLYVASDSYLVALSSQNGTLLWQKNDKWYRPIGANGILYAITKTSETTRIVGLDGMSGVELWTQSLVGHLSGSQYFYGDLIIADGSLCETSYTSQYTTSIECFNSPP